MTLYINMCVCLCKLLNSKVMHAYYSLDNSFFFLPSALFCSGESFMTISTLVLGTSICNEET